MPTIDALWLDGRVAGLTLLMLSDSAFIASSGRSTSINLRRLGVKASPLSVVESGQINAELQAVIAH